MVRFRQKVRDFLFFSDTDLWLSILRIGLGVHVLFYTWSLRDDWELFFLRHGAGPVSRTVAEALVSYETHYTPRLGWLVATGEHLGLGEGTVLTLSWLLLTLAAFCLLAGLFCRASAILTWGLYLCSAKSGALISYGVDNFATIGLFYLMIAPLPDRVSVDARLGYGKQLNPPRLGFHRRVLQIHLCLIYSFGGIAKFLGPDWWNGTSVWRALTRPPFNLLPAATLIRVGCLLPLIGIVVVLLETGYPIFIWMRKTKAFWLLGIVMMHVTIGVAMGLYQFALVMIVLNLAAFGPDLIGEAKLQSSVST